MNQKNGIKVGILCALLTAGFVLAAAALFVKPAPLRAWTSPPPCDFLTGGGWIVYDGAKANFGVAGGCKHGSPTWGHLEYHDHGTGLDAHWTAITAYEFVDEGSGVDSHSQPTGTRLICGNAHTNQFGDVYFALRAEDLGEPGINDQFDIRMRSQATGEIVYDTTTECFPHYLGSTAPCAAGNGGGGNIQLHKPNPSTSGAFGGTCPGY